MSYLAFFHVGTSHVYSLRSDSEVPVKAKDLHPANPAGLLGWKSKAGTQAPSHISFPTCAAGYLSTQAQ